MAPEDAAGDAAAAPAEATGCGAAAAAAGPPSLSSDSDSDSGPDPMDDVDLDALAVAEEAAAPRTDERAVPYEAHATYCDLLFAAVAGPSASGGPSPSPSSSPLYGEALAAHRRFRRDYPLDERLWGQLLLLEEAEGEAFEPAAALPGDPLLPLVESLGSIASFHPDTAPREASVSDYLSVDLWLERLARVAEETLGVTWPAREATGLAAPGPVGDPSGLIVPPSAPDAFVTLESASADAVGRWEKSVEEALAACAMHVTRGAEVWRHVLSVEWRRWEGESRRLAAGSGSASDLDGAARRLRVLFRRASSVPLLVGDATSGRTPPGEAEPAPDGPASVPLLRDWERWAGSDALLAPTAEERATAEAAAARLLARLPLERAFARAAAALRPGGEGGTSSSALAAAASAAPGATAEAPADPASTLLAALDAYLALERSGAGDGAEAAGKRKKKGARNPTRVPVLFERALALLPLAPELWARYARFVQAELGDSAFATRVLFRACRNCPWEGGLWARLLQAAQVEWAAEEPDRPERRARAVSGVLEAAASHAPAPSSLVAAAAECFAAARRLDARGGAGSAADLGADPRPGALGEALAARAFQLLGGLFGAPQTAAALALARLADTQAAALADELRGEACREATPSVPRASSARWGLVLAEHQGGGSAACLISAALAALADSTQGGGVPRGDSTGSPAGSPPGVDSGSRPTDPALAPAPLETARALFSRAYARRLPDGHQEVLCRAWLEMERERGSAAQAVAAAVKVDAALGGEGTFSLASAAGWAGAGVEGCLAVALSGGTAAPPSADGRAADRAPGGERRRPQDRGRPGGAAPGVPPPRPQGAKRSRRELAPAEPLSKEEALRRRRENDPNFAAGRKAKDGAGGREPGRGARDRRGDAVGATPAGAGPATPGLSAGGGPPGPGSPGPAGRGGDPASRTAATEAGHATAFVKHLSPKVDEPALRALCARFGDVVGVRLARSGRGAGHKGFAYVDFGDADALRAACRGLDGREFEGKRLFFAPSDPPGKGGAGAGSPPALPRPSSPPRAALPAASGPSRAAAAAHARPAAKLALSFVPRARALGARAPHGSAAIAGPGAPAPERPLTNAQFRAALLGGGAGAGSRAAADAAVPGEAPPATPEVAMDEAAL